jgi:hypothetical protein
MARRPRVRLLEVTVTAEKPNLWKWHVFERDVEVMHGHETSRGMHRSYSGIRRTPSAPRSAVVKDYYNSTRTHWSLNKDAPVPRGAERARNIVCRPILGGLHHQYARI